MLETTPILFSDFWFISLGSCWSRNPHVASYIITVLCRWSKFSQSCVPHFDECSLGERNVNLPRYWSGVSCYWWNPKYGTGRRRMWKSPILNGYGVWDRSSRNYKNTDLCAHERWLESWCAWKRTCRSRTLSDVNDGSDSRLPKIESPRGITSFQGLQYSTNRATKGFCQLLCYWVHQRKVHCDGRGSGTLLGCAHNERSSVPKHECV